MMTTKYITYEQYLKQENKIRELRKKGIELTYNKSKIKIVLGGVCIVIAIIPNGLGFIFYPVGVALLTSGGIDVYALIKTHKQKLRFLWWRMVGRVRR